VGLPVSETELPPPKPYHPTTFLERGVAVPFTTPLLGGTRARQNKKNDLELVVPNPSGGRGVYITPWAGIRTLCRPTLHDTVFSERIMILDKVTPGTIRRVARTIAAEGLAGAEAMEAARIATKVDESDRTIINYQLLMTLVGQIVPNSAAANGTKPLDQAAKVRQAVAWVSTRLERPSAWTASALEDLADALAEIGVGAGAAGRMPRIVAMLRTVRTELAEWIKGETDENQQSYADMVCSVADLTLSLADAALASVKSLTDNMVDLLRAWAGDPRSVIQLAGRPEWLLDGWEQICLLWNDARDDADRRAALVEVVGLIPVLPNEVNGWAGNGSKLEEVGRRRGMIFLNEDWRTGMTVFGLIARNERFRAIAC
jgi:hypothetical protein